MNLTEERLQYLELLSQKFPSPAQVSTEIINLNAILGLPKGSEHFISDIHGEYRLFLHILKNASGSVRRKIFQCFTEEEMPPAEVDALATLIYYPEEKLALLKEENGPLSTEWYTATLLHLVQVCRKATSKYTRSKVRKAMPRDFAYIIDELLHTHPDENNYRIRYHERIIDSILETDSTDDFIRSLSALIKRLAVDHLHLVGDVFDRGGGAAKIMDRLMDYHSLDIQWGNHDILWMGAAAGEEACIISVLRNNLRYDNYEILENDYGISLRALVAFANKTYHANDSITPLIKAINVLLFKLEGQIIMRHPEFDMQDRLLLDKIDTNEGTIDINGTTWKMRTNDFPTVDPERPYDLTEEERAIVDKLVAEFTGADHLRRHIEFLYSHGSVYLVRNGNLLFHGCVPMNDDGTFSSSNCMGTYRSGRDYLDFCDNVARRAWRTRERDALDWMWYLWIGFKSPMSGRLVKTFERSYIEDRTSWEEPMDPYFTLTREIPACDAIMREFRLLPGTGHIINGHTPVKTVAGEKPIRADGRLLVIDGGFCRAYHPKTGIAGYTLISSSRGMRLKAHEAFKSVEAALTSNADIQSVTTRFDVAKRRLMVSDTDTGEEIRRHINDLRLLLDAYRNGVLPEVRQV